MIYVLCQVGFLLSRPLCRSTVKRPTGTSRWNSTVGPRGTGPSPLTAIALAWFGSHQRVVGSECIGHQLQMSSGLRSTRC